MPIITSTITHDDPQVDGRRYVRELHLDQLNLEHPVIWLAAADTDVQAVMQARVPQIELDLMTGEIAGNVADISRNGKFAKPSLNYSLAIDNGFAVKAAYDTAIQVEAVMMGDYFNTLSDEQLMLIFQLPVEQVSALRTDRLEPAAALAATLRAEAGALGSRYDARLTDLESKVIEAPKVAREKAAVYLERKAAEYRRVAERAGKLFPDDPMIATQRWTAERFLDAAKDIRRDA
jgi:hypothetical protein